MINKLYYNILYSNHHAGVLVPAEQGVLAALGLRLLDVGPRPHEVLVRHDARQLPRDAPYTASMMRKSVGKSMSK